MLKKIAHNSTLPALAVNNDLKPLQELIAAEKNVLAALQKLSADLLKAAECLRNWGSQEGDDLSDTLSASNAIIGHFATSLTQYSTHEGSIREQLKAIRTREENLDELKRRRKAVFAKADTADKKLSKMSPENKNLGSQTDTLNKLREEIRSLDADILNEDSSLGDFKRSSVRAIMALKFGGLEELSLKGSIIGRVGKEIAQVVSVEFTQPGLPRAYYNGHSRTEALIGEVNRGIDGVRYTGLDHNPQQVVTRPISEMANVGQMYHNDSAPSLLNSSSGYNDPNSTRSPYSASSSSFQPPPALTLTNANDSGSFHEPSPGRSPIPMSVSHSSQHSARMHSPLGSAHSAAPQIPPIQPQDIGGNNPWDSSPSLGGPQPAHQAVDDFGLMNRSYGESPANRAGNRFATAPTRPPGARDMNLSFQDIPPPPSLGEMRPVAGSGTSLPSYSALSTPGLPPGAAAPAPGNYIGHTSSLPYSREEDQSDSEDREVRFGQVSDIDDELEKRKAQPTERPMSLDSFSGPIYAMDPADDVRNTRSFGESLTIAALTPIPNSPNLPTPSTAGAPTPLVPASLAPSSSPAARGLSTPSRRSLEDEMDRLSSELGSGGLNSESIPGQRDVNLNLETQQNTKLNVDIPPPFNGDETSAPLRSPGGPMADPDMAFNEPAKSSERAGAYDHSSFRGEAPYRPPLVGNRTASGTKLTPSAAGPRTIAAAAFKRPPPRAGVPTDTAHADISPLAFRKRDGRNDSSASHPDESGKYHGQESLGPNTDEPFDYISAYVNNPQDGESQDLR